MTTGTSPSDTLLSLAEAARSALASSETSELTALQVALDSLSIAMVLGQETPDGMFSLISHNAAYTRLMGLEYASGTTTDQVRHQRFLPDRKTVVPPRDWPAMKALRTGEVVRDEEVHFQRPDGRWCVLSMSAVPIPGAGPGEARRVVLLVVDITERKVSEERLLAEREKLSASEAKFRTLIEKSTELIMVSDIDRKITFWSPSATHALGWTASEMLGTPFFDLIHPDDVPRIGKVSETIRKERDATAHVQGRFRHKDGSWREHDASVRNALHEPGIAGVVINSRDMTEQRKLEAQLLQAQKLDSVGRLAGGVAHDFNNLLMVIGIGTEELKSELPNLLPAHAEVLEEIAAAGDRARDLTRQLLAFARQQVNNPVTLDLNTVVRGSVKMLRRMLREDIELVTSLQPGLWNVRCDVGQIEQVLVNLAVNARDAMPDGGKLIIETKNVEEHRDADRLGTGDSLGPQVKITVRDSGHGMSADVAARVFEPFFTTKPMGQGSGLGLATVYGIVKQSGGTIQIESEPGHGTTFEIHFPRTLDAASSTATSTAPKRTGGSETILVAEDDPAVSAILHRALSSAGYRVLRASRAHEAVAAASLEPHVDLLVSDVVMPGRDGLSLARELKQKQPSLRVLLVSGYSEDVTARRGVLDAGFELLLKPFTTSLLLQRVRDLLDSR